MIRHGTLAFLRGRFADVLNLADSARALNLRAGDPDAERYLARAGDQYLESARHGRCAEAMASLSEDMPIPRWIVGKFLYEGGLVEQAHMELRRGLVELDGRTAPGSGSPALAAGAELANRFGDAEVAAAVLPLLEPARADWGVRRREARCVWAPTNWIGQALAALGQARRGRRAAALCRHRQRGGRRRTVRRPGETGTGPGLERRAGPGDRKRARGYLLEVERLADELEMPWTSRDARAAPSAEVVVAAPQWRLWRNGEVWTLDVGGRSIHLKASKGLEYLAALIAAPGTEITALDLASGGPSAKQPGNGSALLDDEARLNYLRPTCDARRPIRRGRRARRRGRGGADRDRTAGAARRAAPGQRLGGRSRAFADETERPRVNVTRTIRQAVERVGEADPSVGAHLSRSIRTGTRCVYQPEIENRV